MKRLILSLAITLGAFFPSSQAAVFTVENLTIEPGQTGQLVVGVNNTETNLSGFQFKLSLPEGVLLTKNQKGKFIFTLSERIEYHTLSVTELNDGSYQFICYPPGGDLITGNSGELLSISVTADGTFSGYGEGALSDILVTDVDTHTSNCNNVSFTVCQPIVYATGISLNSTTLTLTAAGQTATLTATVTPSNTTNKNVTWTSSNTAVATVSSTGVVNAKSNGTATITAKTADGTNLTATCAVTVAIPVLATGISLNSTTLTLTSAGQTATLTATVTPSNTTNKNVTWTSSNTAIATVSNTGVVTAKSNGTAVITATTVDGTNLSAQCTVNVSITPSSPDITFADDTVKALCVANWDTNHDGELSEAEAAAVTDLGEVFKENTEITSFDELTYFTGLTSIGSGAFCGCSSLTSLTIPEGVTSIGIYAFYGCSSLTSLTIPEGVTSIGNDAFDGCSGLTSLTIPEGVTSIGSGAFYGCSSLTSLTIPESVTNIGSFAFRGCSGLTSLTIPEGVTSIGESVFRYCSGLISLTIPEGVTSIGVCAFEGCSGLTSLTIPESVTSIGNEAFRSCSGLTSLTIPEGVTSIGDYTFSGCSGLTSLTIPESVTSIGKDAFWGCSGLTSLTIPEGVTSIGNYAFRSCSGLTSLTIPEGVTSIGDYTFSGCSGLTSLTIPEGVTSIGKDAFHGCSGLTSLTIPESVTSIGNYAFYGCSGLTSVYVKMETPPAITADVFSNRANATLIVPAGCKAAFEAANYWKQFKEIIEIEPSPIITFADAAVKTLCVANWDTNHDGELSEAEAAAVTDLGTVFKNNTQITSFDELQYFLGLTTISEYTFQNCKYLTSIFIPSSVSEIKNFAFMGCNALTKAEFSSLDHLCNITFSSFYSNPMKLAKHLYINGTEVKDLVIPNNVTVIGNNTFEGCTGLLSVSFHENVTTIEDYAFSGCTGISSITIPSHVTSIGGSSFVSCTGITAIAVAEDNSTYDSRGVCNGIIEKATNTLIIGCKNTIIPNSVTAIGSNAFACCSGLSSIIIPNSVTTIGSNAFQLCSGLTSISIPESVSFIGNYAFSGCNNITSVRVNNPIPVTISSMDFPNRANATLYVPAGCKPAYEAADYWKDFKEIVEMEKPILFANATVKTLCVANWDTNGDGELNEAEAAAVTDLGEVFKGNTEITSFDELTYFTGLTSIGSYAFCGCNNLTSIIIPNSVTSIGNSAFWGCGELKSINIPNTVTSIGYKAFNECSGLTSIIIPNSVTSIAGSAFNGCSGLTSINIPNSVTSIDSLNPFSRCSSLDIITVDDGNTIYDSRNNCNAIINSTTNELVSGCKNSFIPNNVTSIGYSAFDGCIGLTGITIPNCVTSIKANAFSGCNGLTTIDIPNSVTSIGKNVFEGCKNLTSFIIPNSITNIPNFAFGNCTNLVTVTIPNSVTSIGLSAFWRCNNLTSVIVNINSPLPIESSCFTNRTNATLYVPYGSKAAYEAVNYWKEFKEIVEMEPSPIITFADAAVKTLCVANWDTNHDGELSEAEAAAVADLGTVFQNNTQITSFDEISYFTGLTSIGSQAFNGCTGLTSITIPENVTSIGSDAFKDCTGLTRAEYASIEHLCGIVFENVNSNPLYKAHHLYINGEEITKLVVPNSVTSIGNYAFMGCSSLTSATIPNSVTEIGSNIFSYCTNLASVSLPENLTKISDGMFNECKNLVSVIIPESVTYIGKCAFQHSGITSIVIPNSVTTLGQREVFSVCWSLTSVYIGSGLKEIRNGHFFMCENLTKAEFASIEDLCSIEFSDRMPYSNPLYYAHHLYIDGEEVTDLVIPNSVTKIGSYTFVGCSSITSVTIPESVTEINNLAFSGCSGITTVKIYKETPLSNCPFTSRAEATLYVPVGCKAAYEAADYWKEFKEIVEMEAYNKGDVNRDGSVTIADVTALVNIILGKDSSPNSLYDHAAADVNGDGSTTIADVTALVNIILGKN